MELTNLFGKINQTSEEPQQFLAVEINTETVKTAVWQVADKKTKVISIGTVEEWKSDSVQELVTSTDASLSKALESIDKEPNKVIFGLPESWVGDQGIAESKKSYLKQLTQKLDLKPVGFVVTTESLVHYLKQKEGGPPTTILLTLSETEVAVTMVRLGNIEGTQVVGRSEDLGHDVEEGIARFPDLENLPSRMLLYDGNIDLEVAKQTLISYDWKVKLPFLHFPKIESLDRDTTIHAIAIAGGTEVAKSLGIDVTHVLEEDTDTTRDLDKPKEAPTTASIKDKSEEFGFTKDFDQIDEEKSIKEELKTLKIGLPSEKISSSKALDDQDIKISPPEKLPESESANKSFTLPNISNLFSKLPKIPQLKIPKVSLKLFSSLPPIIPIGAALLVILFILAFIAYWNVPTANLIIYLTPKTIEKEVAFTLDPTLDILDAESRTIPSQEESIEVEGEKEINTTGKKLIGERAKGKVTIYNRTQSSKTLSSGTILSVDKYTFSLDEQVTIASASTEENPDFTTTIIPSTQDSTVTASNIGDDYNFAKDTQFNVANFASTSFVAKANSDFTGGFSRSAQAVSQEDKEDLRASLLEELKNQAFADFTLDSDSEKAVVEINTEQVITEEYSAKVDDETENLRLTLKLKIPIFTYQLADLSLLVEKENAADIPENFIVKKNSSSVEVIDTSLNDNNTASILAIVKLSLLPKLDTQEIIKSIRGKYPPLTQDYFSSLTNFSRVETKITPSLPARLNTFPRKERNISVEVKIEDKDN